MTGGNLFHRTVLGTGMTVAEASGNFWHFRWRHLPDERPSDRGLSGGVFCDIVVLLTAYSVPELSIDWHWASDGRSCLLVAVAFRECALALNVVSIGVHLTWENRFADGWFIGWYFFGLLVIAFARRKKNFIKRSTTAQFMMHTAVDLATARALSAHSPGKKERAEKAGCQKISK